MHRNDHPHQQVFCNADVVLDRVGISLLQQALRRFVDFFACEDGSNLIETALVLPLLILLLTGAVDYGRGFYTDIEVSSAAEAGALYGTLHTTDASGMVAMAKMNATDVNGMNATAIYGCECADGTGASANCTTAPVCSVNVVQYVEVTTSASYSPTLPYPGIPSSISLQNTVHLRSFN